MQHKRRTSAVSGTENKSSSRPSARLDASTEITKKNRQSHRATEPFTPFGHFLGKNDHKILKRLVLQHKRRTSAVPGTEKKARHALAPALMHRPRSQKRTGRATVLRNLSRRLVIFLAKNDQKILKRLVLQHKRRTSAVPGTEKRARHALAPALMHRPRSQKRTGRATVLRNLSRRLVIFLAKNDQKILKRLVLQHKRRTSAVPGTEKELVTP